jgi:hypothetical protein
LSACNGAVLEVHDALALQFSQEIFGSSCTEDFTSNRLLQFLRLSIKILALLQGHTAYGQKPIVFARLAATNSSRLIHWACSAVDSNPWQPMTADSMATRDRMGWDGLLGLSWFGNPRQNGLDGLGLSWFGMGWDEIETWIICFGTGWKWVGISPISAALHGEIHTRARVYISTK